MDPSGRPPHLPDLPGLNVVADSRMIFVNEEDEPWFAKLDRIVEFQMFRYFPRLETGAFAGLPDLLASRR
jgi:hypothetical protein